MKARLSSHRFRRRLAWTAAATGILALVVGAAIRVGNTGEKFDTPLTDQEAWVYTEPKLHRLSSRERLALFSTSAHFIRTAVARRNLDEAWDLLGPEMQSGQTRRSWRTGSNNVVPFPARGIAAWDVLYSYDDDVALDVALVASPHGDIVGKTFTIELKRYPEQGNRWLVARLERALGRAVREQQPLRAGFVGGLARLVGGEVPARPALGNGLQERRL